MKGLSATTIVIFSILLLVSANTFQFAFADGNDTPAECMLSAKDETGNNPTNVNAGAGNIITEICIKDGSMAFVNPTPPPDTLQHSQLITTNGIFGLNNCYTVSGMRTQVVTVSENCDNMSISHVDYTVEPGDMVGGHGGITDNTALLLSDSHLTASWMIPLIVTSIGIGVFVVTKKYSLNDSDSFHLFTTRLNTIDSFFYH